MKTFKIICFLASLTLIGIHICSINYQDFRLSANKSHYLGIATMTLVGFIFLNGIIKDSKKTE